MPRHAVLALALAFAGLSVVCETGCKKQNQQRPVRKGRVDVAAPAADPRLPAPHKLARQPDAGLHVAAPDALLAAAAAFVPSPPSLAKLGEFVLATQGPSELAQGIASQLDGARAWTGAHVAGEDILHLPLRKGASKQVQELLARYTRRGEFGAVELPPAALQIKEGELVTSTGGPKRLAWVDPAADTLTIAGTLEGVATGRELANAYGARPVWGTLAESRGKILLGRFPYGRIDAVGEGLHELDITASARDGQKLPVMRDIAPGALSGALLGKELAAGASTRWTGYKEAVREAIHQMQVQVDRAGFAGRMMLDPIADQATRVLKMWNGRVLVGVGPARHVRLGLGADDPHAAHKALLTLLRDITENLQLARMFVSNVPNASLKRYHENPDMWLLTVSGVANQVPAEYRTLLDDGRLRVAFNGHAHAGALLAVIGPKAEAELKQWVTESSAAPAGKDGKDLAGATLAVSPEALAPLLKIGPSEKLLPALLTLTADREPTRVVMRQVDERYEISVRGPAVAGAR